jgi:branched-chain amino acid transport system ATP-binding protein
MNALETNALEVKGLTAGYGSLVVVTGVSLRVGRGEMVALLGANGAGKTSTLRALSGVARHSGSIKLGGQEISGLSAAKRVGLGLAHVPQNRGTFAGFTVEENLWIGAHTVKNREQIAEDMEAWFARFPRLSERRRQLAGSLSGGEQQMLAISRAMMTRPKVLMCDEPSLGLAPAITEEVFRVLHELTHTRHMSILVVEQNARITLEIAERAYVIEHGAIEMEGSAAELKSNSVIKRAYLGLAA